MRSVGIVQARARLSSLVAAVRRGEEITITRQGEPVARLVPAAPARAPSPQTIERLKTFRKGRRLGGPVKELIEEGRR